MALTCATLRDVTDATGATGEATPALPAFTPDEIAAVTGGSLVVRGSVAARGAVVDSRLVFPGVIFVALAGERTDGHEHARAAFEAGAAVLLVSRDLEPALVATVVAGGQSSIVRVADTLAALGELGSAWRSRFDPLVIGITGSYGKTSTKEAIAAVLERRFRPLRSSGNQNNEIGLPLTLLRLGPQHEAAVLEMGMFVGGEITYLARLARPSIGVVTSVGTVHIARIGSVDAIEQAKGELVEALPASGTAILNVDDPRVRRMASRTRARVVTYGVTSPDAEVRAEEVEHLGILGMRFVLTIAGQRWQVRTPVPGRHSVENALAAAAVGHVAGLSLEEIAAGLEAGWSAPHRTEVIRVGGITIIDDSYNAEPATMRAALALLGELGEVSDGSPRGRRIAVLGPMLELGELHVAHHLEIGAAAAVACDRLIVVGAEASPIADGARQHHLPADRISEVPDRAAALELLGSEARAGDTLLVKGSRGAALDLLVAELRHTLEEEEAAGPQA